MDPTLDLEARRLFVSAALTSHAARSLRRRIPGSDDAGELLAAARHLGEGVAPVQQKHRLRFEPPYPGLTAGPERVRGGSRIVLACTAIDEEGRPLGVIFTTLIPGRPPLVSVAPSETPVPEGWRPVTDTF
jgi:hypothetical protein